MSFELKLSVQVTPKTQGETSITPDEIRAAIRAAADLLINDRHMIDQIYSAESGGVIAKVHVTGSSWQPPASTSSPIAFSVEAQVEIEG